MAEVALKASASRGAARIRENFCNQDRLRCRHGVTDKGWALAPGGGVVVIGWLSWTDRIVSRGDVGF